MGIWDGIIMFFCPCWDRSYENNNRDDDNE
jgi:hypothetical protein